MVLSFNRFEEREGEDSNFCAPSSRNNSRVDFPLEDLDMVSYIHGASAPPIYDCYAVINHTGTPTNGQYSNYCLSPKTNQWSYISDSLVTTSCPSKVVSSNAVMAFYRRRDLQKLVHCEGTGINFEKLSAIRRNAAPLMNGE